GKGQSGAVPPAKAVDPDRDVGAERSNRRRDTMSVATTPTFGDGGRSLKTDPEARDPLSISNEVKSSHSLLIVDDDRTLREGCASVLQMDGFNVTTLGRGDEALELVRRRKFDIVL